MAENPHRRAPLITLGFLAWSVAVVVYLSAGALTWGKPDEAAWASEAGQWRYVYGPTILTWLALSLLAAGSGSFLAAVLFRRTRRGG